VSITTVHRSQGEFRTRQIIAGLKVLQGNASIISALKDASPATGKAVLTALEAALADENAAIYTNNMHRADLFRLRAFKKSFETLIARTGLEVGDTASIVAQKIRTALAADAAVAALFAVSGSGANIVLTALSRLANDSTLNIAIANGTTAGITAAPTSANTTAGVAPVAQVETATAAGSISGSGNATVIVTAAGMTGSPKTISVAVTNGDSAATWAGKVRTALAADADVTALFTVGGSTTAITLTRTTPAGVANDATLNISLDNGTCTGITTAGTSANTTAGVAGTFQVETATVAGAPTQDGNVSVIVTANGMTGSPKTLLVDVQFSENADIIITDAMIATLAADAAADQTLRAALVTFAQDYIPGFTGVGITNAGRF